jgi:Tfp pilus assembly protein PilF
MYDLYHDGLKDPAKTKALLTKAITVIPDSTQLLRLAGEYYKSIGDKDKARSYYQQALNLDPKDKVSQQALENL